MTFRLVAPQSCRAVCPQEIAAQGMITLESAGAFRAAAASLPPGRIVVRFDSAGGNLVGGLELGNALRELNATTSVNNGARCVSACAYAFLGGARRSVTGGRIGVHNFSLGPSAWHLNFSDEITEKTIAILTDYVTRMDADPALVTFAARVPAITVRYLDAPELRRYRVVN